MQRRTFVRPEAHINISEAAVSYQQRETGLGQRFLDEIHQSLRSISMMPLRFPVIESGVRRLLLHRFPYAVYFVVESNHITIIAVLHQHQAPQSWIDEA